MTDHAEQQEHREPRSTAELMTEIVVAYVTRNTIAQADLCDLIGAVSRALKGIGREQAEPAIPEPAIPVRRSIQEEHLACLVCGKRQRVLRRHLEVAHQLTPDAYRKQFGLKPDYPMAAPAYSRQRSEMARLVGLGQRAQVQSRRRQPRSSA